jgi:hypothetical protein
MNIRTHGNVVALCLLVLCCAAAARADSFSFSTLPPGGAISGQPGATIGWGYSITNQSPTDWLVLVGIGADAFLNAAPDASIFDFPILAPMGSVSVAYNPITLAGLFQMTWDPRAPIGFMNSGTFLLTGDFCTDSSCRTVVSSLTMSASYSATVSSPVGSVPEPGTGLLLGAGLCLCAGRRRRSTGGKSKS